MEWQPIDTAPKDGTFVLITDGETIEVARTLGSGWIASDGADFDYGRWDEHLTHWMPLPPAPTTDR